ncbi:MAG: dephospho-CoA kinase [Candidatus Omnitrophica bacterium CG12_big_fil_rev_8_21_14_0_65_50_5]|nr:MAG: dephospho-CoA kinase [Candidatus Omnitrophica bacterium CG12_big_fil_rev_8_21_14_0_65_50_5]
MVIVGVTGGLGTGKSTVARMFMDLGAHRVDADELARQCLESGTDNFRRVVEIFGGGIIENGEINRAKVAEIVFRDSEKLEQLESIVHPFVHTETRRLIEEIKRKDPQAVVIWDIPLLFEKKLDGDADTVVVVAAEENQQNERAVKGLKISPEDAARRIKKQMFLDDKIKRADFVIRNDGSLDNTRQQVADIWKQLKNIKS